MLQNAKWGMRLAMPKKLHITKGLTLKFMCKFEGPFPIVESVLKVVYKLELPPEIKVHMT